MFIHKQPTGELPPLKAKNVDGKRFYEHLETGSKYPSITSVLSIIQKHLKRRSTVTNTFCIIDNLRVLGYPNPAQSFRRRAMGWEADGAVYGQVGTWVAKICF